MDAGVECDLAEELLPLHYLRTLMFALCKCYGICSKMPANMRYLARRFVSRPVGTAVAVTDWRRHYGPGIPAGEHEKIFQGLPHRLGRDIDTHTQGSGVWP